MAKMRQIQRHANIVITFEKHNFHSDFSFGCFLSQRILLYSLFYTALAGARFGLDHQKGGFYALKHKQPLLRIHS